MSVAVLLPARQLKFPRPGRQRGTTLVVALIMLTLLLVHALASFTAGTVQLRIVGSMHARQEAQAAAQVAIGRVLGSSAFIGDPVAVTATPLDVDIDGDGRIDYRVVVTPTCQAIYNIDSADLDPSSADDARCATRSASGGMSPCADAHWLLHTTAVGASGVARTGAVAEVSQGVRVRLDAGEARAACGLTTPPAGETPAPIVTGLSKTRKKTYWYMGSS